MHALYAVSVRQASALPLASCGFHLTMDTLAIKLTIPLAGFVWNFHPLASVRCWAYNKKGMGLLRSHAFLFRVVHPRAKARG
jgi:hypothetical protein